MIMIQIETPRKQPHTSSCHVQGCLPVSHKLLAMGRTSERDRTCAQRFHPFRSRPQVVPIVFYLTYSTTTTPPPPPHPPASESLYAFMSVPACFAQITRKSGTTSSTQKRERDSEPSICRYVPARRDGCLFLQALQIVAADQHESCSNIA